MAKTGALTLKDIRQQPINSNVSFVQKIFDGFLLNGLKNLPQFKQKFWIFSRNLMHSGQGGVSALPVATFIPNSFSDKPNVMNIPINVRIRPAANMN
jgi:hypothetical protein